MAFHDISKGQFVCFKCGGKAEMHIENAVFAVLLCSESHLFHALFCSSQKGVGVRSRGFHPSRGGFSRIKVVFSCIRNAKIAIKMPKMAVFGGQKGENTKVFLHDAVFASIDYQYVTIISLYFCIFVFKSTWLPILYIIN